MLVLGLLQNLQHKTKPEEFIVIVTFNDSCTKNNGTNNDNNCAL